MINQKGFTLIEILVVMGIIVTVMAFGISINLGVFTSGTLQGEESKIISVLERARSRSMANMFESPHGVCFHSGSYVIFYDTSCDKSSSDEIVEASTNIASTSDFSTNFPAVTFEQLSGNNTASNSTITVTDGVRSLNITINNAGTINW